MEYSHSLRARVYRTWLVVVTCLGVTLEAACLIGMSYFFDLTMERLVRAAFYGTMVICLMAPWSTRTLLDLQLEGLQGTEFSNVLRMLDERGRKWLYGSNPIGWLLWVASHFRF